MNLSIIITRYVKDYRVNIKNIIMLFYMHLFLDRNRSLIRLLLTRYSQPLLLNNPSSVF